MRELVDSRGLLNKVIEFVNLVPEKSDWDEKILEENPPRLIRFLQIRSLLNAYNLGSLKSFIEGKFICKLSKSVFLEIDNYLNKDLDYKFEMEDDLATKRVELLFAFKHLLEYNIKAESLLSQNSNVFASSGYFVYAYDQIADINSEILKKIENNKIFLGKLMSPNNTVFDMDTLKNSFKYPDENIDLIDSEWM